MLATPGLLMPLGNNPASQAIAHFFFAKNQPAAILAQKNLGGLLPDITDVQDTPDPDRLRHY